MKSCIVKRTINFKSFLPPLLTLFVGIALAIALAPVFVVLSYAILIAALCTIGVILPSCLFTEYEYNLEGGEFSVALIKNKAARKELFSCDMSYLIIGEPYKGQTHLSGEKLTYTAKGYNPFYLTFSEEGKTATVIFSPNEDFLNELRLLSPSKVKLNIMY